jgi:hypothetical protein
MGSMLLLRDPGGGAVVFGCCRECLLASMRLTACCFCLLEALLLLVVELWHKMLLQVGLATWWLTILPGTRNTTACWCLQQLEKRPLGTILFGIGLCAPVGVVLKSQARESNRIVLQQREVLRSFLGISIASECNNTAFKHRGTAWPLLVQVQ